MTRPFAIVCLSHLRWDFVYQRPQHLLSRFARRHRVWFVEEPIFGQGPARLEVRLAAPNLWVATPRLPAGLRAGEAEALQRSMLDRLLTEHDAAPFVLWYYTPMALPFTRRLEPVATVYDCMDELSAFAGAPPGLLAREAELLARADLVFTGGQSLYEAKRRSHPCVYAFPSSVDTAHFARARRAGEEPADQRAIPHPRLGFFGVLDERLDRDLLLGIAEARPDWQLVLVGPVVKIDPATLPRRPNLHYLGPKPYGELPSYLAGWDVALLPFARNEATRFISPTKTLEYLAGGKPVVSTSIRDVVRPYGELGLVRIADTTSTSIAAIEGALDEDPAARLRRGDAFLAGTSWDWTWAEMARLLDAAVEARLAARRRAHVASGPASAGIAAG